jgi:hypothetical protein
MTQQPLVGQGVLIIEASWSRSDTPHRYDSSGRVISLTKRGLPDNTQHSQDTNIHATGGIRTHDPISERSQAHAVDCTTAGINNQSSNQSVNQ